MDAAFIFAMSMGHAMIWMHKGARNMQAPCVDRFIASYDWPRKTALKMLSLVGEVYTLLTINQFFLEMLACCCNYDEHVLLAHNHSTQVPPFCLHEHWVS